jgi:AraC-like DNA-binding protein
MPSCLKCWTHNSRKLLKEQSAQRSISEQVRWILKRLLAGSRPDVSAVARELGLSDRTSQRRIVYDGSTFRQLLLEAGQELAREYLNRLRQQPTRNVRDRLVTLLSVSSPLARQREA